MDKQYTVSVGLNFDEDAVRDFLLSITDAVNGMFQPVYKTKTKIKRHKKYFTLKVKVKFVDGTKMRFKRKFVLDVTAEFVNVQNEALSTIAKQLSEQQPKDVEENNNTIGFNLD